MVNEIGVCSWSLRPHSVEELCDRLEAVGARNVQLALDPLREGHWKLGRTLDSLRRSGVTVRSGMMVTEGEDYSTLETIRETGGVRPTRHWKKNLRNAGKIARLARELELDLVSFHAGFLPEERSNLERQVLIERLREIIDVFREHGVRTAFETGQETAAVLLEVLDELNRTSVGVNFDPANMILYDKGDPIEALELLSSRVFQIHVKDATRTKVPGTWGAEVPVGTGEVDWSRFFDVVRSAELDVDLMIEREAGEERVEDIRLAHGLVTRELERIGGVA